MMQPIYTQQYIINFSHIDNRGIARPSALFDLMQDAATVHSYQLGIDKDALGILWVLSRMQVQLHCPLLPGAVLTQQTWCEGVRGVSWCRCFRFLQHDVPVADAVSTWVMLDADTHRILRPASLPQTAAFPVLGRDFRVPEKLSAGDLAIHHIHTVRYSDLDVNNHLNNVKTVDLIADALELHLREGLFISAIQVNYTAECRCGEHITLSVGTAADGAVYVRGATETEVKFEATAALSPYVLS